MSVERDEAERIAALARLRFEADELDRLTDELNHILDHVEALKSLQEASAGGGEGVADGVVDLAEARRAPTRGPGADTPDRLREPPATQAPEWRDGFFVVPPLPGIHEDEAG